MSEEHTKGPFRVNGCSIYAGDKEYFAEVSSSPMIIPVLSISANRGTVQREIDLRWIQCALNHAFVREGEQKEPNRSTSHDLLRKWQEENHEWHSDPVLEILEEYAEWRERQTKD